MARLNISIYKGTTKQWQMEVVGRKMTDAWLNKHYGKEHNIKAMYLCHKNDYGLVWVTAYKSDKFGVNWALCDYPKNRTKTIPYSLGNEVRCYIG